MKRAYLLAFGIIYNIKKYIAQFIYIHIALINVFCRAGHSGLVLRPKTTEDVSEILKYCNDKSLAVCPQAGNTSMSGGSVALFDEVVVSMERMNSIINFDPVSGKYPTVVSVCMRIS